MPCTPWTFFCWSRFLFLFMMVVKVPSAERHHFRPNDFLSFRNISYMLLEVLVSSSIALQWRHDGHDSVSNHQPHDCLLNRLFRHRSKKTLKLRVTGLYDGNSPVTGEFHTQRSNNAENVSIWWRHHCSYCVWFPGTFCVAAYHLIRSHLDKYQWNYRWCWLHARGQTECVDIIVGWL